MESVVEEEVVAAMLVEWRRIAAAGVSEVLGEELAIVLVYARLPPCNVKFLHSFVLDFFNNFDSV
jgi:hypothetical protein